MELSNEQLAELEEIHGWACCMEPERRFMAGIRVANARAIMEKFVNKVDTGMARSTETYAEMKAWLED